MGETEVPKFLQLISRVAAYSNCGAIISHGPHPRRQTSRQTL